MSEELTYRYEPQTVSHPGETLKRTLDALELTQTSFARRVGQTPKSISNIVQGKAPITPDSALAFEHVLDVPASFWNARQAAYDEAFARHRERERLRSRIEWLANFPVSDMIEKRFIPELSDRVEQLRELLDFFGVAGLDEWHQEWQSISVSFRQSEAFESSEYDVAAWLRHGELLGRSLRCADYDETRFREALVKVRGATRGPLRKFCEVAKREFSAAGVALVFTPELPKTRVYGATRWLSPNRALIQLSFRYRRDDSFFFTLFHEAAHVLLHPKRATYLELEDGPLEAEREEQANQFARELLIPPEAYARFLTSHTIQYLSHGHIEAFSERIGVAPGIVVGRLHRDGEVPHRNFRKLIRKVSDEFYDTIT